MVRLTVLDAAYTRVDEGVELLTPLLAYNRTVFKPNRIGNKKVQEPDCLIAESKMGHLFLTGFLPRVSELCKRRGIAVTITQASPDRPDLTAELMSVDDLNTLDSKFRRYQEEIANLVVSNPEKRGVIEAPTGVGKTRTMISLIQRFHSSIKVVIIVPSTGLLKQTEVAMRAAFPDRRVAAHGGGAHLEHKLAQLVVTTRQSAQSLPQFQIDLVIVDECHLGSDFDGELAKFLRTTGRTIWARYGFTATLPDSAEAKLSIEGLIGPLLARMDMETAMELDVVARPRIKLVAPPTNEKANEKEKYDDLYREAIIFNRIRNVHILQEAQAQVEQGKKVLILITALVQGEELQRLGALINLKSQYINGDTDDELIEEARVALNSGECSCVIASNIWGYGIDIPELDVVIIAGAGRSTAATLQRVGRVLRRTESKSEGLIIDFLDSYRFLSGQVVERLRAYVSMGWL